MCSRINCARCGRPTYAGCGAHVEQVLGSVPRAERCRCREERAKQAGPEGLAKPKSWLRGLLEK